MADLPESSARIQIEQTQTTAPVSEQTAQAMGGAINLLLNNLLPVGTVLPSYLDETTFQSQTGSNWVLCDGRSVAGSQFQSLTSLANIPDMRGRYPRMKDNAAGVDSHGDLALGTLYTDQNNSHVHARGGLKVKAVQFGSGGPQSINVVLYGQGGTSTVTEIGDSVRNSTDVPTATGGTVTGVEVNPKTVVINYFVRIN